MAKDKSVFFKMTEVEKPKKTVMAFVPSFGGACAHYRIIQPAKHLRQFDDINFNVTDNFKLSYPDENVPLFQNGIYAEYEPYDTFIFQRESRLKIFEFMKLAQGLRGTRCIYEIDDSFLSTEKHNPAHTDIQSILPVAKYFWAHANDITVTTEPLAEEFRKFNKNIHIIPNCIDFEFFDTHRKQNYNPETIVVGWAGSPFHYADIAMVEDVITDVVNKYDNVKFMYCGNPQKKGKDQVNFFKYIDAKRKILMPNVTIDCYPEMISKIDINLCPLQDTQFNQCKSNLKYLEASALGIPSICSDVYPYSKTKDFQGILVKDDYQSWKYALELLINDQLARREIGTKALQLVERDYNQSDGSKLFREVLLK